ncbi:TetR/AcrR family transcriptional regulator [Desulfonatronum thioautotrophicum]|uniref:TetR/AcrR family transcriptional regulator n=1 Tax=Desulfonatronum thioautotrophicum TaxID=617001 RepID=UPI00069A08B2|nr:TetR/AcrR family transcriptional regulator [Desulfonatronum thioautotrophicum]
MEMLTLSTFYGSAKQSMKTLNQSRSYHHGRLKATLLRVAEELLEKQGVAGLSLRSVSRAANVSHAAPYRHYQDKTDLLKDLAYSGYERLAAALELAARNHDGDPVGQLMAAGRAYVTLAVRSPELTNLMFGGLPVSEMDADLQLVCDRAFAGLVKIIEEGQQAGIYEEENTLILAVSAWSTVHGLASLICTGSISEATKTEQGIDQLTHSVCATLLRGMLKRPDTPLRRPPDILPSPLPKSP